MPKRFGFLYEKMLDPTFIRKAIFDSARHKHKRKEVKMVLRNVDLYTELIRSKLLCFSYMPSNPKTKTIYDVSSQKYRKITVLPYYPDGIIQQLIVNVMKPILMKNMLPWCAASIPNRGTHYLSRHIKHIIHKHPKKTRYFVETDIEQYYPSTRISDVIKALSRKIKDNKFLILIASLLSNYRKSLREAFVNHVSPFDISDGIVGMRVGYYMNQWLQNFYLNDVDRFLLSLDGVSYEFRYMDNITFSGSNKKKLHSAVKSLRSFVFLKLHLKIKHNWQIYPIKARRVSSVGYRFSRDNTIMRKRNFLRLSRQSRRIQKKMKLNLHIPINMIKGFLSRVGQLKHCDSNTVFNKYVAPIGYDRLRKHVSNYDKIREV